MYGGQKAKLYTFLASRMDGNEHNYSPQRSVPVLNGKKTRWTAELDTPL